MIILRIPSVASSNSSSSSFGAGATYADPVIARAADASSMPFSASIRSSSRFSFHSCCTSSRCIARISSLAASKLFPGTPTRRATPARTIADSASLSRAPVSLILLSWRSSSSTLRISSRKVRCSRYGRNPDAQLRKLPPRVGSTYRDL